MSIVPPPNRLVVLASFDPDGEIAPHLRRHIEAWHGECRRLIVVSTSPLNEDARAWLSFNCELVERENYGYDFYSYRVGLLAAGDLSGYDEVVICNDTFVGPLRPYAEIFAGMAKSAVDFWGMTQSRRIQPHVQSFFVVFRHWVATSRAFGAFWQDMEPVSDRRQVIHRFEVGLSQRLLAAGFTMGSFFSESPRERKLARARVAWWVLHRQGGRDAGLRRLFEQSREAWNPMYALADAAVHGDRLPLVKLELIRFDPYGLGTAHLLESCARVHPAEFEGVAEYLGRTAGSYPPRPGERLRSTPRGLGVLRPLVAYR